MVNGRRVIELEMSKADQLAALRAAGIEVPRTVAAVGRDALLTAADGFPVPFIVKPNQGGKGLGVRRFESLAELGEYVRSDEYEEPVDGIALLQEFVPAAEPFVTRVEIIGGRFHYAIAADTGRGGYELCPADACAVDARPGPDAPAPPGLFTLREGFDHPVVGRYLEFARRNGIEIAGFEFIETADGRAVTYDVNTNTNYNPDVDASASRSGPDQVAAYLKGVLDDVRKGSV